VPAAPAGRAAPAVCSRPAPAPSAACCWAAPWAQRGRRACDSAVAHHHHYCWPAVRLLAAFAAASAFAAAALDALLLALPWLVPLPPPPRWTPVVLLAGLPCGSCLPLGSCCGGGAPRLLRRAPTPCRCAGGGLRGLGAGLEGRCRHTPLRCLQAGRQAGRQAGGRAGRQAGREQDAAER
jgi:hypothetical protein